MHTLPKLFLIFVRHSRVPLSRGYHERSIIPLPWESVNPLRLSLEFPRSRLNSEFRLLSSFFLPEATQLDRSRSSSVTRMTSLSPSPASFTLFTSQVNSKFRSLKPESVSTAAQTPRRSIVRLREDVWGPPKVVGSSGRARKEEKHEVGSNVNSRPSNKKRRRNHWTPAADGEQGEDSSGHQRTESRRFKETKTLEPHPLALPLRRRKSSLAESDMLERSRPKEPSVAASKGREVSASSSRRDSSRHRSPSPRTRLNSHPSSGYAADILCRPIVVLQQRTKDSDYEGYLTNSTISPGFSYGFLHLQMDFLKSTVDRHLWSSQPQASAFIPPKFELLNERLLKTQLAFRRIRQTFPIKKYVGLQRFVQESKLSKEHYPFKRALEWIYEEKLCYSRVDWFVENAPLPLLVLGMFCIF